MKMKITPEIIVTPSRIGEKLAQKFGVSRVTVGSALNYRTNSELAEKIRNVALSEYGGEKVTFWNAPACDTTHNGDEMIQVFTSRVKLVVNVKTGKAGCYIDGDLKSTSQITTIPELMQYQNIVMDTANQLNK